MSSPTYEGDSPKSSVSLPALICQLVTSRVNVQIVSDLCINNASDSKECFADFAVDALDQFYHYVKSFIYSRASLSEF